MKTIIVQQRKWLFGLLAVALVGLSSVTTRASLMNVASGKPILSSSGYWGPNPAFIPEHVTNGGDSTPASLGTGYPGYVPITESGGSYWLPPQDVLPASVTVDLQGNVDMKEINLYNAFNGGDRVTADFHVDVSNDPTFSTYSTIITSTLTDPRYNSVISPDIYTGNFGIYRYLRFTADTVAAGTYNGNSPSLNEIRVFGEVIVPEPSTIMLMLFGAGTLAFWRRRRSV